MKTAPIEELVGVVLSSDLSETKVRQTLVAIVDGLEVMPIDCPSILTAQR